MRRARRVVARILAGHRKLKSERGGEVVGNGTSAGDEGWVRMDVVEFAMGGRRIQEREWG